MHDTVSAQGTFGVSVQEINLTLQLVWRCPIVVAVKESNILTCTVVYGRHEIRQAIVSVVLRRQQQFDLLRVIGCHLTENILASVCGSIITHDYLEWEIRFLPQCAFQCLLNVV